MSKRLLVMIFLVTAFSVLLFSYSNADAVSSDTGECEKCHGSKVNSFKFLPAFSVKRLADFDNGNVVNYSACWICHKEGWHGLGMYDEIYIEGSGSFSKTANQSVYSSSTVLHFAHDGYNGGKNTAVNRSCAVQCHGPVKCQACHQAVPHNNHGDSRIEYRPYPKQVADGSSFSYFAETCSTSYCHNTYPAPKRYADAVTKKELCQNCHSVPLARSQGTARDSSGHQAALLKTSHGTVTDQLKVGGIRQAVDCSGCHNNSLTTEHANQSLDCSVCHNSSNQAVINVVYNAGGLQANRGCEKCHFNVGVLMTPGEHPTFHIATRTENMRVDGGAHSECNTCHSGSAQISVSVYTNGTTVRKTVPELARMSVKEYSCLSCHNAENNLAPIHRANFDGQETELTELHPGCATCHAPGTSSENVGQIILKLKSGAQTYDCTECHSGDNFNMAHTGIIDSNCTTACHKISLTDEHLNNPITQKQSLSCISCHKNTDINIKIAVAAGNTNCTACHTGAHNFNILQQVPADIPLYPGYEWSLPQTADIWAGETWMPMGYEGGKLIISNRRKDVTGQDVWAFYKQGLTAQGWLAPANDPDAASNFFSAEFIKDKRKLTVFFYGGENHTAGPVVSSGYRLEMLYK